MGVARVRRLYLVDRVLLANGEARALLNKSRKIGDLGLQLLDGLLGARLLLVRRIYHLPCLLNFAFK